MVSCSGLLETGKKSLQAISFLGAGEFGDFAHSYSWLDSPINNGCFILEDTACGHKDDSIHTLIAILTLYWQLEAEENAWVFVLFAEADNGFN